MLKLRSIFVTSLLTGLVITSNFGCGGTSDPLPDARDVKPDTQADVPKTDVPPEVTPDVKPDGGPDADAPRPDADAGPDSPDVPRPDADGGPTDVDAPKADADGGDGGEVPPACPVTPVCTLGAKKCGTGGGVQTCITVAGCPDYSSEVACGTHQACTAGVCGCVAAPDGCTAAGTFCGSDGKVNTCAVDGNGCKFVSGTPATCPTNTSCKGALPGAACSCDNQCAATGNFCQDAKTAAVCSNDGNSPACRVITGTTPCGAIKGCVGGACVCPATNGTHENEGCNRATDANICDGNHILTCVRDTDSDCDIWKVAPGGLCESDNGGGLTCGTKSGHAACQCPERAQGTTDLFVGEGGSDAAVGVFPTGLATPAACRYGSLTKAFAVASGAGSTIKTVIATTATSITFSAETLPLTVPAGVALTTSETNPVPGNYTIGIENISNHNSAVQAVVLSPGSSIKGFTISNSSTNAVAPAVACATDTAILNTVVIDGNGGLAGGGISVGTSCALTATAVTVREVSGFAVNVVSSGGASLTGGAITGSGKGIHVVSGKVTANGVDISGNGVGIALDTGTTPSIELTNGTVKGNEEGAVVATGTLTATGTEFSGNATNGIRATASTSVTLSNLLVGTNGTGVNGSGVVLTGAAGAFHGVTVSNNKANGIVSSGTGVDVTVDQTSTISGNGASGISAGGGKLTVTGTDIATNQDGVFLNGATTNVNNVNIHNNRANGINILSDTVVINIGTAGPRNTIIAGNTLNGVLVQRSSKTGSESASLKIEAASITNNVASGVHFSGAAGEVFAILRGSVVSSNGGTGVIVQSGAGVNTNSVFQDNDITANGISGVTNGVGGILFQNSSTLSTFLGNKVHLNVGDEVGFFAIQALDPPRTITTVWNISAAGCDAASNPNSIFQHGAGNVGLRAPAGVEIDARNVHWESAPPSNIDDYSNTGGITVTPNCLAAQ